LQKDRPHKINTSNHRDWSKLIKAEAIRLGFMSCGISKAGFLEEEAPRLEDWLNKNRHGEMRYMENHFDKRLDPTKLVDDAKSVVSLLLNYFPEETQQDPNAPKISKYAYGQDYHHVIKTKLKELHFFITENIGEVSGRAFVDSAPVLDKAWATTDHCGSCTACIDACPTKAIPEPYVVDGSKCISYFTIELKDNLPTSMQGKFDNWMFGCDVCQDVCPWNRFSKSHNEPLFDPNPDLLSMTKKDWEEITQDIFSKVFKKSAVKRTKFSGLIRNINFLKS